MAPISPPLTKGRIKVGLVLKVLDESSGYQKARKGGYHNLPLYPLLGKEGTGQLPVEN